MKITWYVEDGYIGSDSRPHTFEVDVEDYAGLDPKERERELENAIQEEFEQNVSWRYDKPEWPEIEEEKEEEA